MKRMVGVCCKFTYFQPFKRYRSMKSMGSRCLWVTCLAAGWGVRPAAAQPYFDVAAVSYQQWAHADSAGDGVSWLTGHVAVPVKLGGDTWLVRGVYETYDFDSGLQVYGLSLPLVWVHPAGDKWRVTATLIPRLSSDLDDVTGRDYQLGGALLMSRKRSETLTWSFGAYYNNEFFGFFMLPLAGIDWRVSERLNIAGVLPGYLSAEYKVVPGTVHAGLAFRSVTNSFRTEPDRYLRVYDNQLRAFADGYLLKHLVVSAGAGRSFFRKYKSGFRAGGVKEEQEIPSGDGWFFKVSLSWRIRLDEKKE
jgi:hypothetical protein